MQITKTNFEGLYVIDCELYKDERGWFFETFRQDKLEKTVGKKVNFVQDNQSFSCRGVLRGLHYQKKKYAQSKLVRVLNGEIQDVVVDLRPNSKTYRQYYSIILSSENRKQLFVPRGFAHGFLVLSKTAEVFYKCDNFYHKAAEGGILYGDSILNIDWLLPESQIVVSEKDQSYVFLE